MKLISDSEYEGVVRLLNNWNELVRRINDKGGEAFLQGAILLSKDDLSAMIRLCHPDKHNNSETANRITKILLEMRAKQ